MSKKTIVFSIFLFFFLVVFGCLYPGPSFEDQREEKIWMPEDFQLEGPVESFSVRKSNVTRIVLSPDNFQRRFENEEIEILVVFTSREIWYIAEEENIVFLSQIKYPETIGPGPERADLSSFTLDEEGNVTAFYQYERSGGVIMSVGLFSVVVSWLLSLVILFSWVLWDIIRV